MSRRIVLLAIVIMIMNVATGVWAGVPVWCLTCKSDVVTDETEAGPGDNVNNLSASSTATTIGAPIGVCISPTNKIKTPKVSQRQGDPLVIISEGSVCVQTGQGGTPNSTVVECSTEEMTERHANETGCDLAVRLGIPCPCLPSWRLEYLYRPAVSFAFKIAGFTNNKSQHTNFTCVAPPVDDIILKANEGTFIDFVPTLVEENCTRTP
jgi:hypothetical protein